MFFFFNDTATTEIYTLSLHDALPIWRAPCKRQGPGLDGPEGPLRIRGGRGGGPLRRAGGRVPRAHARSEEHTSELQSRQYLVCRLLLEKTKTLTGTALLCAMPPPQRS